ncbi:MAG: hypothetical protein IT214_02680 [Chitinophagaceae bacterium]|nr:hypothetical protein [Chitinophagaceae bacterium]
MKPNFILFKSAFISMLLACQTVPGKKTSGDSLSTTTAKTVTVPTPNIELPDVCDLVTDNLVATTMGVKIIKPAQSTDMKISKDCIYTIDPTDKDNFEVCIAWLNPGYTFTNVTDELNTAHGLNQEATAERLEGFGDKAYAVFNKTEDQYVIHVLWKDKLDVQVAAEHFEHAKKLTELILSELNTAITQ